MRCPTPRRPKGLAAALALAAVASSACGGDNGTGPQSLAPVASVTVVLANSTIAAGQSTQATATLKDAAGTVLDGRTVTFSSSSTSVATVTSSGLVAAVAPGIASIIATSEGKTGSATLTVSTTAGRATVDRPDAVTGNQIHIMYVLPSDGGDRQLDVNGTLASSVGSWQTWLAGQTGGRRFRLDTSADGTLDVTFVRLTRTAAAFRSYGVFVRDTIEKDLTTLGFASSTKLYAVYFDGPSTTSCGAGAWPPALPGRVGAMYLQGTPPGAPACNTNPFATSATAPPGYMELGMIHEVLHTLGFVPSNAPHHHLNGHVPEPNDLMYAGSVPWAVPNLVLDVGRDDYYGDNVPAGVPNLRNSAYLLSASSPLQR